jgi:hypothetical protein
LPAALPAALPALAGIFSCTTLTSGASYLDADMTLHCYDAQHWRYIGAAIFWLFGVTMGIPAFFIGLLHHFRVPHLARVIAANAWLREAVQLAWTEGVPQPAVDMRALTIDNIEDAHLEALYAFFLHDASSSDATEILAGTRPPVPFASDAPLADAAEPAEAEAQGGARCWHRSNSQAATAATRCASAGFFARAGARMRSLSQRLSSSVGKASQAQAQAHASAAKDAALQRRTRVLEELLAWCKQGGELSLPAISWNDTALAPTAEDGSDAATPPKPPPPRLRPPMGPVHSDDLPALQERAMREVGFLFCAYRVNRWYWEIVELLRKLALTSILSLIAPGSAGQVVVGLLLAFLLLLLNIELRPYAGKMMNLVSITAQTNLFFVLLVALLLKVDVDGSAASGFYSFLIGTLMVIPIALLLLLRAYVSLFGSLEMRMIFKDSEWS